MAPALQSGNLVNSDHMAAVTLGAFLFVSACLVTENSTGGWEDDPLGSSVPCPSVDGDLCALRRSSVRLASKEDAFRICFVGDGYLSTARFQQRVDSYVAGLVNNNDGFVAMAPDRFSFHRIDLTGGSEDVNNDDLEDTRLGTFPDYNDGLCSSPSINGDLRRIGLARQSCGQADSIVVVSNGIEARANARGDLVFVSSMDPWQVVQHELGHALFGLADEYVEFDHCSNNTPNRYETLPIPNVGRSNERKWFPHVEGVKWGGGHWPCLAHPTSRCSMLDSSEESFCPVCRAHMDEAIRALACESDRLPPRVTIASQTSFYDGQGVVQQIGIAAHDESDIREYRVFVDGELYSRSPDNAVSLEFRSGDLSAGTHTVMVEAEDTQGNIGRSRELETNYEDLLPDDQTHLFSATVEQVDENGWLHLNLSAPRQGTLHATIGEQTVEERLSSGEQLILFPTASDAEHEIHIEYEDIFGRRSSPMILPFKAPNLAAPQISFNAGAGIEVGGRPISQIDALSGEVLISFELHSLSPLRELLAFDAQGNKLGSTVVDQDELNLLLYRAALRIPPLPSDTRLRFVARDNWGREAALETDELEAAPGEQCLPPTLSDPLGGVARPFQLRAAPSARWDAHAKGVRLLHFRSGNASSSRASVFVHAPEFDDDDGARTDLHVTLSQECNGRIVAATATFEVIIDNVAPRLEARPYGPADESIVLDLFDPSGVASVLIQKEDGFLYVDEEPPFDLPMTSGEAAIRAFDTAGNVAEHRTEFYSYPAGNRDHCGGER